jgi:hypothetical protein
VDYVYEAAVMHYITRMGDTFLCPQFPIKNEEGKPWSEPDFVALNFVQKTIAIVEVSSASDIGSLKKKVTNRDNQWITLLKVQLVRLEPSIQNWPVVVRIFVREANLSKFGKLIGDSTVFAESLEGVMCNWKWDW